MGFLVTHLHGQLACASGAEYLTSSNWGEPRQVAVKELKEIINT